MKPVNITARPTVRTVSQQESTSERIVAGRYATDIVVTTLPYRWEASIKDCTTLAVTMSLGYVGC